MSSRVVLRSSVCLLAVLVSVQVMAQSHRASIASRRGRVSKATANSSNATPSSGLNFAAAVSYLSGGNGANSVAIAQLRGTGKPFDLVVTNWCAYSSCTAPGTDVGVVLGNGDGTFVAAVTYSSGGIYADAVAIADVNGDGKPDLIVADCGANNQSNCAGGSIGVLLGNGDGTFGTAAVTSLAPYGGATSVAVADVNGDGFPDLIVATGSNTAGLVGVLLNDGTGKFPTVATYSSGGLSPLALAVADVNGDGKPDVVVANQWTDNTDTSSNVSVLLNDGTGKFSTAVAYGTGGFFPDSVAIADINGDGKVDLVVANSSVGATGGLGNVGVLLGNGDGTFGTAVAHPSGSYGAASVAVADVNGDGKPDIVVANCSSTSSDCSGGGGSVGVLLGNGDGTFQTAVTFGAGGNTPFWVAVDDLNGDGKPDIVAANCVSGTCGAGPGQVGVLLNTSLTATATALTSSPNPSKFGQSVTFTATVTAQAGFDKGTPTGTVSFFDGTTNIGTSNLNTSGVATLTSTTLAVGTDSITATYNGDTNFATSTSLAVQQVVQSAQGATSTALTLSSGTVAVGSSVTLTAKVSAGTSTPPDGETVTFENVTKTPPTALGTGKLSKGTATFTSTAIPAGTYSVVASYPGDANFLPSTSTPAQTLDVQSFTLAANPTTVSISAPGQSGSTTITIATLGNLKGSSVTGFACSGLPSESTCTFGPVSSSNTVSLSITTTGPSARRSPVFEHHQGLFYAMLLPGFLGMVSMAGRKRTLRGVRLLALIVVLGLSAMWVACGGGSSSGGTTPPPNTGTPTGTSTVTVSAASGTLQGSTKITLTVQ